MSLSKGDHLVIKRNGMILTPDVGESYHEFEVTDPYTGYQMVMADGSPLPKPATFSWFADKVEGRDWFAEYTIKIRMVK